MNSPEAVASQRLVIARLSIALLQGALLFVLYRQLQAKAWPATDGLVFAPLVAAAIFVPFVAIAGLANFRVRSLAVWVCAVLVLCVGLTLYDVHQTPVIDRWGVSQSNILPHSGIWIALAAIIFITHSLIAAGDNQQKYIADYTAYYDVSWILGIQHVLAILFVAIFWGILWLGAEMFRLIKIELFSEIIRKDWFFIPATTLALASAIHLTDVRAGIVRGTRTLVLNLLAWLLPVIVLIAVGFLCALLFTGLEPLWNTRRATSILLVAVAIIIVLINTTYQDGKTESAPANLLVYARLIAIATLVPLIALAAYGLWLRIDQYGFSSSRIAAIACIIVAICYAGGYAAAAIRDYRELHRLEGTNVLTAFVIVGVLLALFTPVADPARISVNSQVSRLESGKIPADKFDFAFLRFQSGRYGMAALEKLKHKSGSAEAERIAFKANEALDWKNIYEARRNNPVPSRSTNATAKSRAENIKVVFPTGGTLPATFTDQTWDSFPDRWRLPSCLLNDRDKCEAIIANIDDDDAPEILLFREPVGAAAALKSGLDGKWIFMGTLQNATCPGVREAIRDGKFELITPVQKELKVGDQTLSITKPCVPVH